MKHYGSAMAVGCAIGFIVGYIFGKKRTEKIKEEEIQSILEEFTEIRRPKEKVEEPEDEEIPADHPIRKKYEEKTNKYKPHEEATYIEYISPDEVGTYIDEETDIDYDVVTLRYYKDGVVADRDNTIIRDLGSIIGYTFERHFGEYEPDRVCVRNHKLRSDYEILRDLRRFEEVCETEDYYEDEG